MSNKLAHIAIIIGVLFLLGCNTTSKNNTIYFGGKIENPKEAIVYFYKGDNEIANTELTQDNKFFFKLDSLQAGLYTFRHGDEFQYVYLEPKDSLMMRLNTWDFDESLVFSGKGAERNNYLIHLFLENEKEGKLFYQFFKLNEDDFLAKTDSLVNLKLIQYNQFKDGTIKQSKGFENLIRNSIFLPIYAKKEQYIYKHKYTNQLEKVEEVSSSFYNHRKKVDLNEPSLLNYYAFSNYIGNYIYNLAFYQKEKNPEQQITNILLQQIPKIVKDEDLKNKMIQNTYIGSLLDHSCNRNDRKEAKELFYKNCSDVERVAKVTQLLKSIEYLKKGTKLPVINLKNAADYTLPFNQITTSKNTVVYFWPKELDRIQNMAKRVNYLAKNHPNIHFIGVDGQLDNYNWKAYIKANNLSSRNQYQIVDSIGNNWFINEIPRAIIIDKNGIIQNEFTFLSHHNFEKQLTVLEKK